MTSPPLIEVADLQVSFATRRGPVAAVQGVSFELRRERLGLVGESGSGKSQTGRALVGLSQGSVTARRLRFKDQDLRVASARQWRALRGRRLAMILQDPLFSLNPVLTVGRQLDEASRHHQGLSRAAARDHSLGLLEQVQMPDPQRVYRAYPHELSGGMGQRVMIAMMLSNDPEVLIADEPTSALDVTVQQQILAILDELVTAKGMGLLLISHDLATVASFCDRILVMYAGRIVETCRAAELPLARHPYTRGLLNCLPRLDHPVETLPVLSRDPAWLETPPQEDTPC